MTNKEIYKIWAPDNNKWSAWVRPVPFIPIDDNLKTFGVYSFDIPKINYLNDEIAKNAAIFIDLPNYEGVVEGVALAKLNYIPIPLYNGTNEQENSFANVTNQTIELALKWGASELEKIDISNNALPAFLLDRNRLNRRKYSISMFDNSWDLYAQDIPSADYFLKNGINKIIVKQYGNIALDLKKIFYNFQKKNIKIYSLNKYEMIKEVKISKPLFKERW